MSLGYPSWRLVEGQAMRNTPKWCSFKPKKCQETAGSGKGQEQPLEGAQPHGLLDHQTGAFGTGMENAGCGNVTSSGWLALIPFLWWSNKLQFREMKVKGNKGKVYYNNTLQRKKRPWKEHRASCKESKGKAVPREKGSVGKKEKNMATFLCGLGLTSLKHEGALTCNDCYVYNWHVVIIKKQDLFIYLKDKQRQKSPMHWFAPRMATVPEAGPGCS